MLDIFLFFYFSINTNAQSLSELLGKSKGGYKISGEIKNMQDTNVILAYYFGGKQYASDTTNIINGKFTFSGEKALDGGIYLLVLPDGKYFEFRLYFRSIEGHQHYKNYSQ